MRPKKLRQKLYQKKKPIYKPRTETPTEKRKRLLAKYFTKFKHELRSTYDKIDETLKNNKWFEEKAAKWAKWAVKKIMGGPRGRKEEKAADIIINKTFKETLLDKIQEKYDFQNQGAKVKRKIWFDADKLVFMPVKIDKEELEKEDQELGRCAYTTQRGWKLYRNKKPDKDNKIYWYNIDCKHCEGNMLDPNDKYYINGETKGLPKNIVNKFVFFIIFTYLYLKL